MFSSRRSRASSSLVSSSILFLISGIVASPMVHDHNAQSAAGANSSHGLRRTNEDKRRAVLTLLNDEEWSQWSGNEIARRAAVSPDTVSRMKASLSESDSEKVSYRDKHGNLGTMNTSNIGRRAEKDEDEV